MPLEPLNFFFHALYNYSPAEERPDLSALKPLWQLYTTLVKEYGILHSNCGTVLTPPPTSAENKNKSQQTIAPLILRSLTELFLNVENLAEV